ncbi:MAG: DUF4867 family protein [Ruminococcaceae bacterium]|nr:DUF4867 family protein [Oscillospiraceae bacterium]
MLNTLKEKNPTLKFYSVNDKEFEKYGKVITNFDTVEIIKECEKIEMPSEGSKYELGVDALEKLEISKKIQDELFGELDTQIGACYGHSNYLNGLEWHKNSEINIAATPLVLILGTIFDIKDGKFDSKDAKAFYLEKGQMVEVYATTLHFCPCEVSKDGFFCVVGLPKGTNGVLDNTPDDKLLFRKNKWLIAHEKNQVLLDKGVIPGIYGENYKVNY